MAVTTPASTATIAKLIDPGIKKQWADEYSLRDPKLELVLKVDSMTENYEEHSAYTGLGSVPLVTEGATYGEDSIIATYTTTFTAKKYGNTMPVTVELYEDQNGPQKIAGRAREAARVLARKSEILAASIFNNAFSTSYTSYGDAKPLCSTDHTRADGGTAQSNASATSIPLTEANLETAVVAMRAQLDDRGQVIAMSPKVLLVPPALEKEAFIITGSDKRSGTADNDLNVYGMKKYTGGMLDVIVWDYLGAAQGGSDTAWFLLSDDHKVTWKWRKKPMVQKLDEAVGAKNDIMYWKYNFRAAFGWLDWRGVWGSQGTGAAYSS